MTRPTCITCHGPRPANPCPGCGQDRTPEAVQRARSARRIRNAVRRFWAADTETLMLVEAFEQAAAGQGCEDFPAALKAAMQEAVATWGVPS